MTMGMGVTPGDMSTPALVREFAAHRAAAHREAAFGRSRSAEDHARLVAVVDELRSRGVLD
jgi:hypothetical protein